MNKLSLYNPIKTMNGRDRKISAAPGERNNETGVALRDFTHALEH